MLTPERLLRLMIELIFVLLGGLLMWLGLAGPAHGRTVDRHGVPWLVLSVALIVWGLRALYSPGQWWLRWQNWTRGLSLALLGVLLLVIRSEEHTSELQSRSDLVCRLLLEKKKNT